MIDMIEVDENSYEPTYFNWPHLSVSEEKPTSDNIVLNLSISISITVLFFTVLILLSHT